MPVTGTAGTTAGTVVRIPLIDYTAGAVVATDLVNTSPTVRTTEGEVLPDPIALAAFLADHDLHWFAAEADGPPLTADDVREVQLLRREVRGVIEAETEEYTVAGATMLLGRAGLAPTLYRDAGDRWQWHIPTVADASPAERMAAFIGAGLLGVIRTLGHERFRACQAPDCRGVFVDTSRAGQRRYCMPDRCGNRLNLANYRARRRIAGVTR